MSRKRVVLAAGLGIAIGYLLKEQLDENKKISPEKALQYAKETFQKNGPINGSWIYIKPEKIDKNGLTYNTYRGGISRHIDGANKQFDFYVDIATGAIIDTQPITAYMNSHPLIGWLFYFFYLRNWNILVFRVRVLCFGRTVRSSADVVTERDGLSLPRAVPSGVSPISSLPRRTGRASVGVGHRT